MQIDQNSQDAHSGVVASICKSKQARPLKNTPKNVSQQQLKFP